MKLLATAALTGAMAVSAMAAQANDHTDGHTTKPAVKNPSVSATNAMAPVEGANSFTETQAQNRLVDAGYTNVSVLTKNDQGQWYGTATKGGVSHKVLVDYQGNVTMDK